MWVYPCHMKGFLPSISRTAMAYIINPFKRMNERACVSPNCVSWEPLRRSSLYVNNHNNRRSSDAMEHNNLITLGTIALGLRMGHCRI